MPKDRRARLRGGFTLNKDVMRSHMHVIAQRIGDQQFIYDLGALPYTWGPDYGLDNATTKLHYLHSSIKGFVDESEKIEQQFKLHAFFTTRIHAMQIQNLGRIMKLRAGSQKMKVEMFGGTAEQDVNETPAIKEFYGANTTFLKTLEELRSFATYQFNDVQWAHDKQFLAMLNDRLKKDPNNIALKTEHDTFAKNFYTRYAQAINQQIDKLYKFVNQYGNPATWQGLISVLNDMKASLDAQIEAQANSIGFSRKLKISSRLGKAFEPIMATLLANTKQGTANFVVDHTIADKNFLTDLVVKGKKKTSVNVEDSGTRFLNGISVKFTSHNSFKTQATIHTDETLLSFTQGMEGNQIDALAYLYNNIVALTLYNSSDRKKGQVRAGLIHGENRTGRLFFKMLQYYNLYLINTFLWGNAKDAGVQPFNKDFFNNIGKTPAPVFLANQNQFYESWKIFQNMQDQIIQGQLIWVNDLTNSLFSDSRTGQAALRELYATKAAWLTQSSDAIYDVLRHRPKLDPMPSYLSFDGKLGVMGGDAADNIMDTFLNPNWNPYRDILAKAQSRVVRAKIELFKYY